MTRHLFITIGVALATLVSHPALAENTVYGAADLALLYTNAGGHQVSLMSSGDSGTFVGFKGEKQVTDWLAAGFVLEAGFNADTGAGTATNVSNTDDGGRPACTLAGVDGASCNVNLGGAQGIVFQRESRIRLLLGRDTSPVPLYGVGNRHQLSFGRFFTPALATQAQFSPFGLFGPTTSLSLGSLRQGATAVRASNSVSYSSPSWAGLFVQAMYAFGERGNFENGDLLGARIGFKDSIVQSSMALQITKLPLGDVVVGNTGVSVRLGPVALMGLGQHTWVRSETAWNATFAQFGSTLSLGDGLLMASFGWLNVLGSRDDSAQLSLGYRHKITADCSVYLKGVYVLNHGQAKEKPAGTPVPLAGEEATAALAGMNILF
ncbi:MAG: porin [Rhizobacter sp.]